MSDWSTRIPAAIDAVESARENGILPVTIERRRWHDGQDR